MTPIVKICGLSTPATLEAALTAGADMVGFVFFAKSPRNVGFRAGARARRAGARPGADRGADRRRATTRCSPASSRRFDPDILQLHGRESPARVTEIGARFGRSTMKAIGVAAPRGPRRRGELTTAAADFLLIDAKPPKDAILPGGNGLPFDWRACARLSRPNARGCCRAASTRPTSPMRSAATGARGVDVSSGVESAPGREGRSEDRGVHRRRARGLRAARP